MITNWIYSTKLPDTTDVAYLICTFQTDELVKKSDCVIVLGAAVYEDKPSPVFEERIRHAINLYKDGRASKIIFTGGFGNNSKFSESEVGAKYALHAGVPEHNILVETTSHTTQQNLFNAEYLMQQNALKTAIIVSDPLHLKRALIMAKDLRISAVASATPTSRYQSLSSKTSFLMREIYFVHHYFITGN